MGAGKGCSQMALRGFIQTSGDLEDAYMKRIEL